MISEAESKAIRGRRGRADAAVHGAAPLPGRCTWLRRLRAVLPQRQGRCEGALTARALALCLCLWLGATLPLLPAAARAQGDALPPQISALTLLDQQYMDRQRATVDELARLNLGTPCCDSVEELPVLQRLLDEGVVGPQQRPELQALGIVLGDILAAELDMDWVIYEDRLGRSRALRLGDTDNYLFPVTMISRRREAGNMESVEDVFNGAYAAIAPLRPKMPYQ